MKLSTTIILVLLTGALIAFIATHEHHQPGTVEKMTLDVFPFQFKPEDADEIELDRKDATLRLALRNGSWRVGQPFEDPADPDLVKELLEAVRAMEWVETLDRKELRKEDIKRTGLGDDTVKITVRSKGEVLAQASFGAAAPLDGCVYAAVPKDKEHINVARTTVPSFLSKADDEWRDPKLVRLKAEDINLVTMSAGTSTMEFARTDAKHSWQIVKPLEARASDENFTAAIINPLLNMKVKPAKINTPAPTAGADLPVMTITVGVTSLPKPVVFKLHPNADPTGEVQVEVNMREGVFLTSAKAGYFWKFEPNHLRDQHLVRIPKEQTTALRIRSPREAEVALDKKGVRWMLTRFGKVESANQERVAKLFDTLNAATIAQFLSNSAGNLEQWGLKEPDLTVEWQVNGKTSALEFGQTANGVPTARIRDEPFIYLPNLILDQNTLINAIPTDSLRWRSQKLINVSLFAMRRIVVAEGDKPPMTLFYDPTQASWSGTIAGRDITPKIITELANQLMQRMIDFQPVDWSRDRAPAVAALQNPTLTIQLLLANPFKPAEEPKPVTLTFAPLQPGVDTARYHGRKDDDPDTFTISRELYRELITPVIAP